MNKRMKELNNLPEGELKNKLDEIRMELIKEIAQSAIGTTVKNPAKIKNIKRNKARILFLLQKKQEANKKA